MIRLGGLAARFLLRERTYGAGRSTLYSSQPDPETAVATLQAIADIGYREVEMLRKQLQTLQR